MAATPGALQARQSSANLARRETVWSVVGSRLWISDEDVSDQTFVGVHIASIAPRRMGMDLGLMFVPDFSDGVGFSGDLGLAYPLRTSSGLLFVPRAGLSMLLLLPELGWTGPHAGGGLIVPDRRGSVGLRFDAVLTQYTGSSAFRLIVGLSSLPDWL
ncbi:MAG TPA: hypothetical protein VKZ58_06350 [Longimicrobiales bacterium]|nr:hypothetical protein [Longimicrobiales bacterium]